MARAFTPNDIPAQYRIGWWKSDDPSSLTLAGSAVTEWLDQWFSIAATQDTGSNQPQYDTNLGAIPAVRFDGTDDFLSIPTDLFTTGGGYCVFSLTQPGAKVVKGVIFGGDRFGTLNEHQHFVYNTPEQDGHVFGTWMSIDGGTDSIIGSRLRQPQTPAVHASLFPRLSREVEYRFYGEADIDSSTDRGVGDEPFDGYFIGAQGVGQNFDGLITDVIVLTEEGYDIYARKIEGYLAHRAGSQEYLPQEHYQVWAPEALEPSANPHDVWDPEQFGTRVRAQWDPADSADRRNGYLRSIGMDLGSGTAVDPLDAVGPVPRVGWQKYSGTPNFGPIALVDDQNTTLATTIQGVGGTGNSNGNSSPDGSDDQVMFERLLRSSQIGASYIDIVGITYTTYDLVVILETSGAGLNDENLRVKVQTLLNVDIRPDQIVPAINAGNWQGGYAYGVNYVIFRDLTATDIRIRYQSSTGAVGGIAGLQILEQDPTKISRLKDLSGNGYDVFNNVEAEQPGVTDINGETVANLDDSLLVKNLSRPDLIGFPEGDSSFSVLFALDRSSNGERIAFLLDSGGLDLQAGQSFNPGLAFALSGQSTRFGDVGEWDNAETAIASTEHSVGNNEVDATVFCQGRGPLTPYQPDSGVMNVGTTGTTYYGHSDADSSDHKQGVVIVLEGNLVEADRQKWEGWAHKKYSKRALLPIGHPYQGDTPLVGEVWTPRQLGAVAFLDFNAENTVTQSGGLVSALAEATGNGNDFSNGNGAEQPPFVAGGYAGLDAGRRNNVVRQLLCQVPSFLAAMEPYQLELNGMSLACGIDFSGVDPGSLKAHMGLQSDETTTGSNQEIVSLWTSSGPVFSARTDSVDFSNNIVYSSPEDNIDINNPVFRIDRFGGNGTDWSLSNTGAKAAGPTAAFSGFTPGLALQEGALLAGYSGGSGNFNMGWALYDNREWSEEETLTLEGWAAWRPSLETGDNSIVDALPADHPHKNHPPLQDEPDPSYETVSGYGQYGQYGRQKTGMGQGMNVGFAPKVNT